MLDIAAKLNESNEQRTDLLFGLIHVGPKLLRQFINSTRRDLDQLRILAEAALEKGDYVGLVDPAFRIIHTIKGNAALFDLSVYKSYTITLEDELADLGNVGSADSPDWVRRIIDQVNKMEDVLSQTEKYLEEMVLAQHQEAQEISTTQAVNGNLVLLIEQLNREFDKQATLRNEHFDLSHVPQQYRQAVAEIVTQLVSNAAVHGIEKMRERRELGKTPVGMIYIEIKVIDDKVRIRVQDDGAGPNLVKIRQLALQNLNYIEAELNQMSNAQLAQLMFVPGLTTIEVKSDIAGRGVGMDMINKLVDDCNGRLHLRFTQGQGCQFDVEIPGQ